MTEYEIKEAIAIGMEIPFEVLCKVYEIDPEELEKI